MKRCFRVALITLCWLMTSSAFAEPTPQERALAESLFQDGKRLVKEGDYATACAKFTESQRLDPQLGTLLYMAACHQKLGRTASAWAEYTEAASLAGRAGERERERIARERAAGLETQLSRLVVEVVERPSGLLVSLDGKAIGAASLDTPFAVDPGSHLVEATATGRGRWSLKIEVPDGPHLMKVSIPALPPEGEHHQENTDPAPRQPKPDEPHDDGEQQRIAGFVVGSVGVAVTIVGGIFGVMAAIQADDADEHCEGKYCDDEGLAGHERARDSATASTVLFVVGLATAAAGLTVVLTAPSTENTSFYVGPRMTVGGIGVVSGVAW